MPLQHKGTGPGPLCRFALAQGFTVSEQGTASPRASADQVLIPSNSWAAAEQRSSRCCLHTQPPRSERPVSKLSSVNTQPAPQAERQHQNFQGTAYTKAARLTNAVRAGRSREATQWHGRGGEPIPIPALVLGKGREPRDQRTELPVPTSFTH